MSKETLDKAIDTVADDMSERIVRLREENERLRGELARLRGPLVEIAMDTATNYYLMRCQGEIRRMIPDTQAKMDYEYPAIPMTEIELERVKGYNLAVYFDAGLNRLYVVK